MALSVLKTMKKGEENCCSGKREEEDGVATCGAPSHFSSRKKNGITKKGKKKLNRKKGTVSSLLLRNMFHDGENSPLRPILVLFSSDKAHSFILRALDFFISKKTWFSYSFNDFIPFLTFAVADRGEDGRFQQTDNCWRRHLYSEVDRKNILLTVTFQWWLYKRIIFFTKSFFYFHGAHTCDSRLL